MPSRSRPFSFFIALGACFVVLGFFVICALSIAPSRFPTGAVVTLKQGESLSHIADDLKVAGVIRSALVYRAYVELLGERNSVKADDYEFDQPESALKIAWRTINDVTELPTAKVVIPEGSDVEDMIGIFTKALPGFDPIAFKRLATPLEGELFPDTYFFTSADTAQSMVNEMHQEFETKIAPLQPEFASSTRTEAEIITMASLLEKEATSTADRRIIAGILWKRIDAGMALQVDATLYYLTGKTSAQLTATDLKMDSPYNTYTNPGLPPTPINNPGLDSIQDALNPTATSYWYYLSGSDGVTHYAATLQGQDTNKADYFK